MRGYILNHEDRIRRNMIEKLMCGQKIDVSPYPEVLKKLEMLEQDQYCQKCHGNEVQISPEGWPFARIAAACLDAYYQPQEESTC